MTLIYEEIKKMPCGEEILLCLYKDNNTNKIYFAIYEGNIKNTQMPPFKFDKN